MKRIFVAIFITLITSFYVFPFHGVWLPFVNTKMTLAAFAPILMLLSGAQKRKPLINSQMFVHSLCGLMVSFCGIVAVIVNNTHDYAYASYFVSMWVWLGGAYVVLKTMKLAYGKVSIRMVGNFLIAAAVMQCVISQMINFSGTFSGLVDSFMVSKGFLGKVESRLYGIGCALDVAGIKFCAILILIAFFAAFPVSKRKEIERYIYILAFLIVGVFGSMIARTTSIGIVLSIVLWIFLYFKNTGNSQKQEHLMNLVKTLSVYFILLLPFIIYFYNTNETFHANLRFGFEGFFSLVEEGEWIVKSNKMLVSQIVWPDNFKTWMIGDGYFELPMKDYYYTGPAYNYYMGTDVGYCRFVFYFGILGLLAFSMLFVVSAIICAKNNPQYAIVFWMFTLINFIVWMKVSTDLFCIFALFLFLPKEDEQILENTYELKDI